MDQFVQFLNQMGRVGKAFKDWLTPENVERMRQFAEKLATVVRELPPLVREWQEREQVLCDRANALLADRGWYVPGQIAAIDYLRILDCVERSDEAQIEGILRRYARSRVEDVRKVVGSEYPTRLAIVSDALDAHDSGKFTLSVPVLLAQADGICWDIFDRFLFTNHAGRLDRRIRELIGVSPGSDFMCEALLRRGSLQVQTSVRDQKQASEPRYGPLNRHGVLHGVDADYATEANSLRAVLLIDHLIDTARLLGRGPRPTTIGQDAAD